MQVCSVTLGILLAALQAESFSPSSLIQRLSLRWPSTVPSPSTHVSSHCKPRSSNNHRSSFQTRLQLNPDGLDTLRYCLSGAVCASFSHTGSVPIDVIKTKMQLEPERFSGLNTVDAAGAIVASEGALALTTGGVPTLVGYAIQGFLKYGGFEALKPMLYDSPLVYGHGGKLAVLLLAGVTAEMVASTALCPLEAARIANVRDSSRATSSGDSENNMVDASPSSNAFSGLSAILLKMVPYTAAQLTTYELTTSTLYATFPNIASEQPLLVFPATIACAASAAVVSSLVSQPGDALLSERNRMQGPGSSTTTTAAARTGVALGDESSSISPPSLLALARELGPSGLMRGTQARLVQMLAIVVVQLLVYDSVKQFVGLPITGTH